MADLPMAALTDADLLSMLAMRDKGLSQRQIAARMGLSRDQVAGMLRRIDADLAKSEKPHG